MILCADVGNHKVAFGVFPQDGSPERVWTTRHDNHTMASPIDCVRNAMENLEISRDDLQGSALASVVPDMTGPFAVAMKEFAPNVLVLDSSTPTGLPLLYNPPEDLGPDRIANALAARELFGGPCCVVDIGTATTFDVVSAGGEFIGGAIAPGPDTAAESLFKNAARLKKPQWDFPERALGQSTTECLLSGIGLGYAGLVDNLVHLLDAEAGPFIKVVATGGMSELLLPMMRNVQEVRRWLTLEGLNIAYHKVKG